MIPRKNDEDLSLRIGEVDLITKRLYEDYILSKISEDRYLILDKQYGIERKEVIEKISELDEIREKEIKKHKLVVELVDTLRSGSEIKKLTRELIEEYIDKVIIYEKVDNEHKKEIYFKNIGIIDM